MNRHDVNLHSAQSMDSVCGLSPLKAAKPVALEANLGRAHAVRRAFGSLLLNKVMMKVIARRDISTQPQMAIFSHDLIGQAINVYGWWEHEELLLLRAFLDDRVGRGGTMIDIGANIGNHTVFLRDMFEEVHAIEANPRTFRLLQLNVEAYAHVTPHNFAASDQDGHLDFVIEPHNVGASHVAGAADAGLRTEHKCRVVSRRLEGALVPSKPVRLIKIDVEGHELSCLRGARELIRRDMPFVVFEQLPDVFVNGTSPVIEELRGLGYRTFHVLIRKPGNSRSGPLNQLYAALWAGLVGFRIAAVPTESFKPAFYEMIIASP